MQLRYAGLSACCLALSAATACYNSEKSKVAAVADKVEFRSGADSFSPVSAARARASTAPPTVQKLVRSGDIRIELHDVDAGMRLADSIAVANGGMVADSRVSQTDRGVKDAQLTIRVPADRFQVVMAALRGLGQVRNEGVSTEDITRAYTDLEIRLAVKEGTVARLRALLANQTGKLADVLAVERELDRAVSELEQMKGERRFDDQRVAMSTINASLYQPTGSGLISLTGPVADALRRSIDVFGSSLSTLIYLIVFLIPWIVIASALWWGIRKNFAGGRARPYSSPMPSPLGPVPGIGYSESASTHELVRLTDQTSAPGDAVIAEEVPVAFVYNAESFVVVMASPADLEDLGVGFSLTEGIVDRATDVEDIEIVRHSKGIELQMTIPAAAFDRLRTRRRALETRTGCGICGIEALDDVLKDPRQVVSGLSLTHEPLWRAAAELETKQPVNFETRAVHAAAFADPDGRLLVVREDVGRHNALDKVIGSMLTGNASPANGFLVVTSRASYELVQKTAVAGVPVLAAVSRPTSLAIQLADRAGITLVGLLRGRTANVYSHMERVRPG